MADTKISLLEQTVLLTGAEFLPLVQPIIDPKNNKKVTINDIMALAPVQSVNGLTGNVVVSGGDMVLASVQTNSGAKTFLDTTLLLRNVANTFNGSFLNTNSADRIYTLPNASGTVALTSDIPASSTYWTTASGGTATGTNTFVMGTNPFIMTSDVTTGTGATAGHRLVGNSLTTGNLFDVSSSSVTTGALGVFTSTSTDINHTAGTNGLVGVLMSGANSTDNKAAIGFYSKVTNTRTAALNTNIAAYLEASGGGTNLALRTLGNVFITNTSGDTLTASTRLDVRGTGTTTGLTQR